MATFDVQAEVDLVDARIRIAHIQHFGPDASNFLRENHYWVDLCATPRRPCATASYSNQWPAHRNVELGALVAFPPGQPVLVRNAGGRHVSLICELDAKAVDRHLPNKFEWTDHRREACLNIANDRLRGGFLRIFHEVRNPGIASSELCASLVSQLSIELARFLAAVDEPDQKGGLSAWRQRLIDQRIAAAGPFPTAAELAELCKLSTRQLRRGFRASHGCSMSDYLAQMRIETAKRHLFTDVALKQIAELLGYSSQANFSGAFRRATGWTPSEFRNQVAASSR